MNLLLNVFGALYSLFALAALVPSLSAQALRASDYLQPQQLPRAVQPYQQALGDRLRVPGRERVTSLGTFTDARGTSPAVLSWELPGRLRFERSSTGDRVIQAGAAGLVATAIQATLSEAEENLVDSLLHDRITMAKGHRVTFILGAGVDLEDEKGVKAVNQVLRIPLRLKEGDPPKAAVARITALRGL